MIVLQENLMKGDAGIEQTIRLMIDFVRKYKDNPDIKAIVENVTYSGDCQEKFKNIKRIFQFVVERMHYVADPNNVELVKSAKHTLLGESRYGDCDDLSVAVATLLMAKGYKVWFRTVAWKKETGKAFTHVYLMVLLPCGKLAMPLDPTMKMQGFGNEVRYHRKKDWRI